MTAKYKNLREEAYANGISYRIEVSDPAGVLGDLSTLVDAAYDFGDAFKAAMDKGIFDKNPSYKEGIKKREQQIRTAFTDAGYGRVFLKAKENLYWPPVYVLSRLANPWYDVVTCIGTIRVHDRKRVTALDWSDTVVSLTAERMFPNEDVTKDGCMIHAWTDEKMTSYLRTILEATEGME